jgi:hypothetical protein
MFSSRQTRRSRIWASGGLALALLLGTGLTAEAQNYGTDARRMGMGGVGESSNLAWEMVPAPTPYRSIPVPLGLFQLFGDLDSLNPTSNSFNPATAMSYASSPLHYGLNRGGSSLGSSFILDIVNAGLNPDLNAYRGFVPKSEVSAQSLVSPGFGKTMWLVNNGATFQGVYLGAGPYLSLGTDLSFDEGLVGLLAGSSDSYSPNTTYSIDNGTDIQAAMAFTGGYRMKLPIPGGNTSRDGIYLAANYNHLYGLRYEKIDLAVQLETDPAGLLGGNSPVVVDRLYSSSGKGRSLDFAAAFVIHGWDFTASIEGLGNHIDWRDLGAKRHSLADVTSGGSFTEAPLTAPTGSLRFELPVRYGGGVGYNSGSWAAGVDIARGTNEQLEYRGGLELSFGPMDVRGGTRRVRDEWLPTAGLGFNLNRSFGIDVAMMQMINNMEGARESAIALSLRLSQPQ